MTDPESRLMPVSGGGVEHAYNAQLGVEHGRRRRVDNPVSQHPTDTQELPPAGAGLQQLPEPRGQVNHLLADTGYCREANGTAWEPAAIIPLLATGRTVHHPTPAERCADPGAAPNPTDPVGRMEHRVQPPAGKALYAKRKSTVEPVFGSLKPVMQCRHLLLRGLPAVHGEWNLVCIAYTLKRLPVLPALPVVTG